MAKPRVLVVDDEADILAAMAAFLKDALGVEVVAADSGAAGLEVMAQGPVDLIVSDYRMPGMDGLQFLKRASELQPDAPRILLTAFPDMQLAINALNHARISRFITKPVDPDGLKTVITNLLDTTRRRNLGAQALKRSVQPRPEEVDGPVS
ncbi:MAG: adenylate cyclase [Thermoplasmata archaeon]|jgi:response regulator RpfG family c-di-GMP phosphodiesterase|nr:adenylate cyclase [Thermoplasmata archaeon]MEA3165589.1 adenylate cyclase [Thermoplasmata archaeon]